MSYASHSLTQGSFFVPSLMSILSMEFHPFPKSPFYSDRNGFDNVQYKSLCSSNLPRKYIRRYIRQESFVRTKTHNFRHRKIFGLEFHAKVEMKEDISFEILQVRVYTSGKKNMNKLRKNQL